MVPTHGFIPAGAGRQYPKTPNPKPIPARTWDIEGVEILQEDTMSRILRTPKDTLYLDYVT